jgi:hypothetical protein
MSARLTLISTLREVAADQKITLPPLSDDMVLLESGLDSLAFAILVAKLEDALGYDPFTASEEVYFPATLGELIKFYENAAP